MSRLHERLAEARGQAMRAFERIGLELFVEPADRMFLWARFPHIEDPLPLAEASQRDGIMLAPGTVFRRPSRALAVGALQRQRLRRRACSPMASTARVVGT